MRPGSRLPLLAVVLCSLPWLGCGGSGSNLTEPQEGTLEITTVTSGAEPDADGYAVSVDGAAPLTVGANAVLRREGLAAGTHSVELSGLAGNCAVSGETRREVSITADQVTGTTFTITCAPTTGAIRVTTATDGPPDADGYLLLLDGVERQPLGPATTVTLDGIFPGAHTVALGGVAANCRIVGDQPRAVEVAAGATVDLAFAIECEEPPPTAGTLEVVTITTGASLDPDGYRVQIDGGTPQEVGINSTTAIAGLAAGTHAVELLGVAANCTLAGDNPRQVAVPAGGTARVQFDVACSQTTGSLTVSAESSGSPADPDGYSVRVDGGAARSLGNNGSTTFAGLATGSHTVELSGLAANCTAEGENPRTVTVATGATARTTFTVGCAATTGSLRVTVDGLPGSADAAVTVTGPGGFSRSVTATRTLDDLAPGSYTVAAAEVTRSGTRYTPSPESQSVEVTTGETASATVTYAAVAGATLNLRIDGWHLTQSVQTADNDIPLVANRDGYLRVFVVANESNRATPTVRVRLFRNGAESSTLTIQAPGASTPTSRDDEPLRTSWNVPIPRELIGPGLGVLAEVDPGNAIAEQDETDNAFPASGTPRAFDVRSVPGLGITFVPVRQRANDLQGDVNEANRPRYLDLTRKLYPLAVTDADVHAVYTTDTEDPLVADNANDAWSTILHELEALRVAEGSGRQYYGVVKIGYSNGVAGVGFIGAPTAMGYDLESDRSRVMAHELGHTWGRDHSPSCGAPNPDTRYPHAGGAIGAYGIDMGSEILRLPNTPDIMGYCGEPWISDYTYRGVLNFRGESRVALAAGAPRRSLLVWGKIVNGRPALEPAFEVVTRPSLPTRPGPYAVEGLAADGSRVFDLSFDALTVADDPRGSKYFAFAVPLSDGASGRLAGLRLAGPGGQAARSRVVPPGAAAVAPPSVEARRGARGAAVRWDGRTHPMVMVRDARTGQVLSIGRGGQVDVETAASELELLVSDGVTSRRVTVPVAP